VQDGSPSEEQWKPFDQMYEVSAAGVVRNRFNKRPVKVELPRAGDPHQYVRLVLKDSPVSIGSNNQRRLALRNVVAHCWLPDSAGFKLAGDGNPTAGDRVFYLDKDAQNCSASNLTVLGERQAFEQGLALTSRFGSRRNSQQRHQAAAGAAAIQQAQSGHRSTPPELLREVFRQPSRPAGTGDSGSSMSWPSGYDQRGLAV